LSETAGGRKALRRLSLDRNNHQGLFGEFFVQALAAAAGYIIAKPFPDLIGSDLLILGSREINDDFPLARVQVKSWSRPQGNDNAWHYRLTEKQFNALAGPRTVPAFLVVVVVPPSAGEYTHADPHRLRMHRAAYWASLADRTKIDDPSGSRHVPVPVPRQNLLTVDSLAALFSCPVPAVPVPPQPARPAPLMGTP
jgi:hypothetical protein